MKHAYYLSKDMDELETLHDELIKGGLTDNQIHVLSDHEGDAEAHHIKTVNPFLKTDIVRSVIIGFFIGLAFAILIASIPTIFEFNSPVVSLPFIFVAIVFLGFSTWEGVLWGIQTANHKFASVMEKVHEGQHLLIVDYSEAKEDKVEQIHHTHPALQAVQL